MLVCRYAWPSKSCKAGGGGGGGGDLQKKNLFNNYIITYEGQSSFSVASNKADA